MILGFFSGLIPRLIFDVTCVVVASTATYLVGRHFIREKEGRAYFGSLSSVIFVITLKIERHLNLFLFAVCVHKHFLSFECGFYMHGGKWIRVSDCHLKSIEPVLSELFSLIDSEPDHHR